ncbi:MAG TPA: hypothetical protein VES69_16205 [Pyrinomonadaceae bacterium]|nr:hypothetical protein [Pyrinomonadaceae bacterium]
MFEYQHLQSLLSTVIEQQALFAENQGKADARMTRHEESIASLLAIAEIHDRQFVETDERINALVNVVEKYISREQ